MTYKRYFQMRSIQCPDPNLLWHEWKTKFLLISDMHGPQMTRKVRSEYAPWITENILKDIFTTEIFLRKKRSKRDP